MRSFLRSAILAAALPLVSAACDSNPVKPQAGVPQIETTTFASVLNVDLAASTKTSTGLYYRDLVVGTGTTAVTGMAVDVYYTGWLPTGQQFDSRTSGTGFPFRIDGSYTPDGGSPYAVIEGWNEGVKGMKVGGRRQLIIPPALAYGAQGNGPIPPNSILVFSITLVATH